MAAVFALFTAATFIWRRKHENSNQKMGYAPCFRLRRSRRQFEQTLAAKLQAVEQFAEHGHKHERFNAPAACPDVIHGGSHCDISHKHRKGKCCRCRADTQKHHRRRTARNVAGHGQNMAEENRSGIQTLGGQETELRCAGHEQFQGTAAADLEKLAHERRCFRAVQTLRFHEDESLLPAPAHCRSGPHQHTL